MQSELNLPRLNKNVSSYYVVNKDPLTAKVKANDLTVNKFSIISVTISICNNHL